ncbi:MAG: DUF814 domain-containing protein [Actinobacteria bacterium]|nr:MAG: DUF814 domain-containing protein [Actinomycetota bacterium]
MNKKAVALLSGGLDSRLAIKLILDQGIEVVALNFLSPFCTCTKKGCKSEAKKAAEDFGIELRLINKAAEILEVIKKPKHGFGRALNPCIDCRILMFKKAAEVMEQEGASFIISGEVIGQRPMSQRFDTIRLIEKESGLTGKILRPLSAKHFAPTEAEKKGIVDREKLLAIKGRSRKEQMSLAENLGVNDYPCPAGGCLLTEIGYANKLKRFLKLKEDFSPADLKLLRIGRHFDIDSHILIVGRNMEENAQLERLVKENDTLLKLKEFEGPLSVIINNNPNNGLVVKAASLTARYSQGRDEEQVVVNYWKPNESVKSVLVKPAQS